MSPTPSAQFGSGIVTQCDALASQDRIVDLVDYLRETARASGIEPGDPMAPLVEALALAIKQLDDHQTKAERHTVETARRLTAVLREGRATAEVETSHFRAKLAATEANTIERIAQAIAKSADAVLGRRIRAFDRRTAVGVALALVFFSSASFWAGMRLGNQNARAAIALTESELQLAFREGHAAAELWLDLMRWNDARAALLTCASPPNAFWQNGRRACHVPLWTERPAVPNGP